MGSEAEPTYQARLWLNSEGAGVRQDAAAVGERAARVRAAARKLGKRWIGDLLEGDMGWQDDYPRKYALAEHPLSHEDLTDQSRWFLLTEEEARADVERDAGVDLVELRAEREALVRRAENLRSEVLARLEPIVRAPGNDYLVPRVEDIHALPIDQTPYEALEEIRPKQFYVTRPDAKLGSPLHLSNAIEGMSAAQAAENCVALVDRLAQLTTAVEHLQPQPPATSETPETATPPTAETTATAAESQVESHAEPNASSPEEHSPLGWLLLIMTVAVFAAAFIAVLDVGWIPDGRGSESAKAGLAAVLFVLSWGLATRLIPGRTVAVFAKVFGVFAVAFGVAIAIFQVA